MGDQKKQNDDQVDDEQNWGDKLEWKSGRLPVEILREIILILSRWHLQRSQDPDKGQTLFEEHLFDKIKIAKFCLFTIVNVVL